MPSTVRKKKDHADPNKKRQRMRANVKARKEQPSVDKTPHGAATDEVDYIKYKRGSAGDRSRRGAT
jgi:hypothetical protein